MSGFASLAASLERAARRPSSRPLAAVAASLAKSAQTRRWHWLSYDPRGWWTNRQAGTTFFSPDLHTATLGPLAAEVEDFWCHVTPLSPGDVVVDVGAGIGDHVVIFSRLVGPGGRVVAIEAHPRTARCLKLTVEGNGLRNTSVIEEAAWDCESTLRMSDGEAHEANAVDGTRGDVSIRARPVDRMLAALNLERIDLVKMNIEGAEIAALRGMHETLARTRAVVVSCHDFLATSADDPRRTKTSVTALLQQAGFTTTTRPDAAQIFVRDYVYGRRT
jgi:FkbM family methyltransferase